MNNNNEQNNRQALLPANLPDESVGDGLESLLPLLTALVQSEREKIAVTAQIELARIEEQKLHRQNENLRLTKASEWEHQRLMAEIEDKPRARREYLTAGALALLLVAAMMAYALYLGKEAVIVEWGKALMYVLGLALSYFIGKTRGAPDKNGH